MSGLRQFVVRAHKRHFLCLWQNTQSPHTHTCTHQQNLKIKFTPHHPFPQQSPQVQMAAPVPAALTVGTGGCDDFSRSATFSSGQSQYERCIFALTSCCHQATCSGVASQCLCFSLMCWSVTNSNSSLHSIRLQCVRLLSACEQNKMLEAYVRALRDWENWAGNHAQHSQAGAGTAQRPTACQNTIDLG